MAEHAAIQIWNGLLDVIFPPRCLVCDTFLASGCLCEPCVAAFQPLKPPYCVWCGVPVGETGSRCLACEDGPAPSFNWAHAMGRYGGTLREAIHRLKYGGKSALAKPLGQMLARSIEERIAEDYDDIRFDVVVPVPLHVSRLRSRGYNQAEVVARVVAEACGYRLDADGMRRVRSTGTQTFLTRKSRLTNLRGAFVAAGPSRFADMSVLLVDDVITTTATVSECARVIRDAGAKRVCVLALARAV